MVSQGFNARHSCNTYHSLDRVLGMGACKISDLVRVADADIEGWLGSLLNADAGLMLTRWAIVARRLYRWWNPRPKRTSFGVVAQIDRVHHAPNRTLGCCGGWARAAPRSKLLLRRHWGLIGLGIIERVCRSTKWAKGIVDGFEARRLWHSYPAVWLGSSRRFGCLGGGDGRSGRGGAVGCSSRRSD